MSFHGLWRSGSARGRDDHNAEAIEFFQTFPHNRVQSDRYRGAFGQGDWTCTIARFTGTMKGPMKGPDGKMIPPTNKRFEIDFCTVAHGKDAGGGGVLASAPRRTKASGAAFGKRWLQI